MTESEFSKNVLWLLNVVGHACRIESPEVSAGNPDLNYCVVGVEGHLELKEGNKPKLRPAQYRWINKRVRALGRVAILWHYNGTVYFIPVSNMDKIKSTTSSSKWALAATDRCPIDHLSTSFILQG